MGIKAPYAASPYPLEGPYELWGGGGGGGVASEVRLEGTSKGIHTGLEFKV